jgi:hypothetical protein
MGDSQMVTLEGLDIGFWLQATDVARSLGHARSLKDNYLLKESIHLNRKL